MIVQFFNRGKGGGSGPVEYLLGKDRDREKAELLRGHPDETAAIIDGSPYAKKYTAGCLSFEESDIPTELKIKLMDSFEECIFAGLDKDQYNCLWVQHQDKGRLELNFVIPNVELLSGKRLQPYYYKTDGWRVDAWRTIQNIENGFSDPDDPEKQQTLVKAKDLPQSSQEIKEAIHDGLLSLAQQGTIQNRDDIVQILEANGFEISRITDNSISLKNPDPKGRNIRLKGAFYEKSFRFSEGLQAEITARSRKHRETSASRLAEANERYQHGIESKRAENNKKHPRAAVTHEQGSIQALSMELDRIIADRTEQHLRATVMGKKHQERHRNFETTENRSTTLTRPNQQQNERDTSGRMPDREQKQNKAMRSDRPQVTPILREWGQGQNTRMAVYTTSRHQEIGASDDRVRNHTFRRIGELREQSQSDRAANDECLNTLGRKIGSVRAGKQEIIGAISDIEQTSRGISLKLIRAARQFDEIKRITAGTEQNLGISNRAIAQVLKVEREVQRQREGMGISR